MKKIILFILILAGFLNVIWFRNGNIMGTAEDSLLFYDISHFLPESRFAWMEHPGLGRVTIGLTAARPTYEILTILQKAGLPNYLIQAIILWIILIIAGLGVYFTTRLFFPELEDKYIFLSVLFYYFNPLSLVNVWNRFLSNYIFSFGLLPLITYFFIRGLKTQKYIWSFILVLVLPLFSFAFTYLAFDILLWIWFFAITLFFLLTQEELKAKLFYIKFFILTLLLFILTNIWWIGQLFSFSIYKNINSSVLNFDVVGNLGTLDALSKKMGNLSDIFRLVNASFLNDNSLPWVKIFHSPPFVIIQYLIILIILYAIIKNIKKRSIQILSGLFFLSIYLAKGTNPPFGEFYKFIFTYIPFLQVFRNPFEKASFILSLTASIFIGFGVFNLINQISRKFANLVYFLFLGFILLVWGFPFYTGLVFTSSEPPTNRLSIGYQVKVPLYYGEANQWLIKQGSNFRFIGFPLGDEGITYKWEKGYSGVELSSALFSTPGILHNTAVPYFHDLVPHIQKTLLSQDDFLKLANALNAKFLFVRHDIDYNQRKMENPATIDRIFEDKERKHEIIKATTFGQLTFWENLEWQDRTFYPAKKVIQSQKDQQISELLLTDVNKEEVLIDAKDIQELEFKGKVELSYEKINPAKYIVHIKNDIPFILVFSELFNDAWQASDLDVVYKHFRANFYANGWLINQAGDFEIIIEYLPQRLLEKGEKISMASYFSIILICTFLALKRVKQGRRK